MTNPTPTDNSWDQHLADCHCPAIPATDTAAIREAIARAWCHEENVAKEMDVDLADAVLFQILALIGEKK